MEMTLGANIRARRKALRMTLETLSHAIDWDTGNLSRLERDIQVNTTPERLALIAKALGCSVAELYAESGPNVESVTPLGIKRVPVISYVQAGVWTEISDPYAMGGGMDFIASGIEDLGSNAFALRIKGKSMLPDFQEGDIVIIDPSVTPLPGDMVVAKNGEEEATFKKFRPRGTNAQGQDVFELMPLNEDFATLSSDRDGPINIIGTMVEHRRFRRR